MRRNGIVRGKGSHNVICQRCQELRKQDEVMMEWTGVRVCAKCWEPRHPQDFVRGKPDNQSVPFVLPDRPMVGEWSSVLGEPYNFTVSHVASNTGNNGIRFQATTTGTIRGCRFFRGPSSTARMATWLDTPVNVTLWRSGVSQVVSQTFQGPFKDGWNTRMFTTAPTILASTTYTISVRTVAQPIFYTAPIPSLPIQPNLTFVSSVFNVSGSLTEPTTVDAVNLNLVDVEFDPD